MRNAGLRSGDNSRIRITSIALSSLLVAGFVGSMSWFGFHELYLSKIPMAGAIIGLLFDFLFLSLSAMLFFSTGIIVYSRPGAASSSTTGAVEFGCWDMGVFAQHPLQDL